MKKALAALTALTLSLGAFGMTASALKGDTNLDDDINVSDLTMVAAHVKGIKALQGAALEQADANGDGDVNVTDVTLVAAHVKGIRPLEEPKEVSAEDIYEINRQLSTLDNYQNGLKLEGITLSKASTTMIEQLQFAHIYLHGHMGNIPADDPAFVTGYEGHTLEQLNSMTDRYFGMKYTAAQLAAWDYNGFLYEQDDKTYFDPNTECLYIPAHNGEMRPDLILVRSARELGGKVYADLVEFKITPDYLDYTWEPAEEDYKLAVTEAYQHKDHYVKTSEGTAVLVKHTLDDGSYTYIPESLSMKKVPTAFDLGDVRSALGDMKYEVCEAGQSNTGAAYNDKVYPGYRFCFYGSYNLDFVDGKSVFIDNGVSDDPDWTKINQIQILKGYPIGNSGAKVGMRYSELKKYFDLSGDTRFENHTFAPNYVVDVDGVEWLLVFDMEGKWSNDFGLGFNSDIMCSESFRFEDFGLDPVCRVAVHLNR